MKCESVEQLLALHVGRDLDEERSRLVVAHLQSCTQCIRAVDEYAEASQLLQRLEPQFVNDEVYAGIRRQVLREIERQSGTSVWSSPVSQLCTTLFRPEMRWITAAIVLGISMIAFYFIANRSIQTRNHRQPAADFRSENHNQSSTSSIKAPDSLVSAPVPFTGQKVGKPGRRSMQRKEAVVAVAQRNMLTPRTAVHQSNAVVSPRPSVSAPLRVELQTSDRNIRIIWLGNQQPQAGSRGTSKGI